MDSVALYTSMAERWQEASREVANGVLRACYTRRAERYLELAARASASRPADLPDKEE